MTQTHVEADPATDRRLHGCGRTPSGSGPQFRPWRRVGSMYSITHGQVSAPWSRPANSPKAQYFHFTSKAIALQLIAEWNRTVSESLSAGRILGSAATEGSLMQVIVADRSAGVNLTRTGVVIEDHADMLLDITSLTVFTNDDLSVRPGIRTDTVFRGGSDTGCEG